MPKRLRPRPDSGMADKPPKRVKIVPEAPTSEPVHSARQLRKLLAFDQDLKTARHGLQSFRLFLDELSHGKGDRAEQQALLKEYLESVKPKRENEDAVYIADLINTWSFAERTNNDGAVAAAIVVLGNLLRAISQSLELLPHGVGLCQTLLQEEQQKLLAKALSAEKWKAFLINPTIKLLKEAVCLDGGVFARRIFRARNFTFASLPRNMEIIPDGEPEDPKKPFVRTNAIRFFLSCLKFLDADSKVELLTMREIWSHLTFLITKDSPGLVAEIFETLKSYVLMDQRIPRRVKLQAFNLKFLERVSALYNYRHEGAEEVAAAVHEFLMLVCTTHDGGLLCSGTGFYPQGLPDDFSRLLGKGDNLSLDQIAWIDKFKDEIPVANTVLADFIPKLRPWSSLKQSELLVAIFKAAPELVSHYFLSTKTFTFDPKLTMTWIGYGAFLFNTMQLPMPEYFGEKTGYPRTPPPTAILLDNILAKPLDQKNLARSLSIKGLTSFFMVRLLTVALRKLEKVLEMHKDASVKSGSAWTEGSRKLIDAVCKRIPEMKQVTAAYKATPEDNILHREAISRLLLLYFEVIPQVALATNFDVSPSLINALNRLGKRDYEENDKSLIGLELEHLLTIAGYSPGMRWFSKTEGMRVSTFTALLRLTVDSPTGRSLLKMRQVLEFVAQDHQLVVDGSGLTHLCLAIETVKHEDPELSLDGLWGFLDNCFSRCASSSLKYLELLRDYNKEALEFGDEEDTCNIADVSLITVAMADQLQYAVESRSDKDFSAQARFTTAYLGCMVLSKKTGALLDVLCKKMASTLGSDLESSLDIDLPEYLVAKFKSQDQALGDDANAEEETRLDITMVDAITEASTLGALLDVPLSKDDNSALSRWISKTAEELMDDDHAASLVRLLSSEHTSIRKEAMTNILKVATKIRESSYGEKDQVWLLLSELAESCRENLGAGPVPSAFTAFSVHALGILKNPMHPLYPKINRFLTKRPAWPTGSIPVADEILYGVPSEDDKYYAELSWFLTYLLDSLRTEADLRIFHKLRLLEGVLALGSNPCMREALRTRLLRILYRATCIDGGSTTLVTRFGIMSWLEGQMASVGAAGDEANILRALIRRVWETCDQQRVREWSRGGIEENILSRL